MPIMLRERASTHVPAPEGTHLAICFRVAAVGIQPDSGFGEKSKVVISWELPTCPIKTEAGDKPMSMTKFYTESFHPKSALRQDLVRWRGREFKPEELKGFDLAGILGKPCQLAIVHETNDSGQVKARIDGVFAIPKGLAVPKAVNPLVEYSLDQGKNDTYKNLPQWLQEMVDAGLKRAAELASAEPSREEEHLPEPPEGEDDSVPF